MVALLFTTKIIEGLWEYSRVPNTWKDDVKKLLIAEGREDLINAG